ncbi:prolyl oligopeptidase family serine peptidase [Glycomyces halotolerans]
MTIAAYGSWKSPITAETVARGDGRPAFLGAVGDEVWWTEPRPAEGGRRTLVRPGADGPETVLPEPWNVRNRVHEYGGTPWVGHLGPDGPLIVFTNFDDQRLYRLEPDRGGEPRPLTPVPEIPSGLRWCDMVLDTDRGEVWAVMEEFTGERPTDVRRVLAAVPLDGSAAADRSAIRELTDDRYRFTTGPRLSPDGTRAAWIVWNHPDMPWDGTELRTAAVTADGRFEEARTVAGGREESIPQVEWAPDGTLVAASDRTGWWNLHRIDPDSGAATELYPAEQEFAGPLWTIGSQWFAVLDNGRIACVRGEGEGRLGVLDPDTGAMTDATGPWTEWAPTLVVHGERVVGSGAGHLRGYEVVAWDTGSGGIEVIGHEHVDRVDPAYYPEPVRRTFAGPAGREVHAHVYRPRNPDYEAPEGELPPFAVWVHGGPTGHFRSVLDLELAYFTSRGIGVVEVDYGGSTGYGREYRNRLREQWGVVDVEDCAAVARALADEGAADRSRLAIRGGSAGGWTSAASLTSPAAEGVYSCAAIMYPILDLAGWLDIGTHDFESQYLVSLVGPYEEVPERYRERSPVNHPERISAPFVLLQGLEDAICPPENCELLLERIKGRGVPHAYLTFEGEQHGFRKESSIVSALLAEHSLYAQAFGFDGPVGAELELRA